jgi:hypothetical protein
MLFETEYKLENVAAARVAADKIDDTFRSSTIGEYEYSVMLQTLWSAQLGLRSSGSYGGCLRAPVFGDFGRKCSSH